MPFKIYTYEDPYKLDKADFWSEISALPHFCGETDVPWSMVSKMCTVTILRA